MKLLIRPLHGVFGIKSHNVLAIFILRLRFHREVWYLIENVVNDDVSFLAVWQLNATAASVIRAGTWADNNSCAVFATGHGEYFIRYSVASDICARVQYPGKSVEEASKEVIFGPMLRAGGTGGVIVVAPKGNIALTFNTKGMYRGSRIEGETANVAIFK